MAHIGNQFAVNASAELSRAPYTRPGDHPLRSSDVGGGCRPSFVVVRRGYGNGRLVTLVITLQSGMGDAYGGIRRHLWSYALNVHSGHFITVSNSRKTIRMSYDGHIWAGAVF